MKNIKIILLTFTLALVAASFTGCIKPYDKPGLVTIEASQTAFLVPLVGDATEQASFQSEELLAQAMVATKEVQIPHRWLQTGRMEWSGKWIPAAKLIVVERTPETREWSTDKDVGTSSKNQAICAESSESIGFSVGMNCSAQIYTENDAVKFLYSYNNKTLEEIMDGEIRARVESKFVEDDGEFRTTGADRTGCMFCMFGVQREKSPNRFEKMCETHPKLYDYCMRPANGGGLGLAEVLDYIGVAH